MPSRRGSQANEEAEAPAAGGFLGAQSMYAKMLAAKKAAAAGSASDAPAGTAAAAAPTAEAPAPPVLSLQTATPPKKASLLLFGATNYEELGKKSGAALETDETPNLLGPHRLLAGLGKTRLVFVGTGCTSAHVVALGAGGDVFTWGRNDAGQLGLGDLTLRNVPTRVRALDGQGVHMAATGKAHTVFVAKGGDVFACGASKQGACGPNAPKKAEHVPTPTPVPFAAKIASVACGQNFNLALDESGDVWSWGWSEFGVLGNGTDHEYNKAEGTVKLTYVPQATPERVQKLGGLRCVHVACGQYHCAVVGGDGTCFTWGNGGYGRLGHKDQSDLHEPKPLDNCRSAGQVSCGAAHTAILGWPAVRAGVFATGGATSLFLCGRVKSASQNAWMYPKMEEELRGWHLHCFGVGAAHTVVHADEAVIAWGSGCASGELGLGEEGKKSSANPVKVPSLDGVSVSHVACGLAATLLLVESSPTVDALPIFEPEGAAAAAELEQATDKTKGQGKAAGKRAADTGVSGKAAKKAK